MPNRPERELIAETIGRVLGPPNGTYWSPLFVPEWPKDYSLDEQRALLHTADMILLSRPLPPATPDYVALLDRMGADLGRQHPGATIDGDVVTLYPGGQKQVRIDLGDLLEAAGIRTRV